MAQYILFRSYFRAVPQYETHYITGLWQEKSYVTNQPDVKFQDQKPVNYLVD